MQDAAGNIFVDRSGIRMHSDHSIINVLLGIFLLFQVVFRPAAYFVYIRLSVLSPVSDQSP